MTDIIYKDKFTLDGRLNPREMPNVTKAKVAAIRELFNAGMRGDRIAAAKFTESISTSDALFNAAYLINLQTLPQFDSLPRTWSQIASTRELPDFRPAVLTGIFGSFEGLKRDGTAAGNGQTNPAGIAPVVAEQETYPYATVGQVEASYGRLKKRGFKVGWTWEARINDGIDFFAQIPGEMLNVALDTEEWEVYQALLSTQASRQLAGGPIYDGGASVTANSVLTKRAVARAIFELKNRQINSKYVGPSSNGYNLIVPLGQGPAVRFLLDQRIVQKGDGASNTFVLQVEDQPLGDIDIVETQFVTGTNWYLLPKPGGVRRPVLELGRLRGQAQPELRIDNATGNYAGGATVSPFEGNFYNDNIDMRLRYPLTGILWDDRFVVWSTGVGAAA